MLAFLRDLKFILTMIITPSKSTKTVEAEILQFLKDHSWSSVNSIQEHLNRDYDMDNIKPYTYVSFAKIYSVLIHLEKEGTIRSQSVTLDDKKRLTWDLTR